MTAATLVRAARPRFLLLTPVSVLLGASIAAAHGASLAPLTLLLILAGALGAHIGVNALNEYHDWQSGLDRRTDRTPFSGGSGALARQPQAAGAVLWLGLVSLAVTAGIGGYFIHRHGWGIAPVGALGLLIAAAYTPWINRLPWACLLAPGTGIGLMVVGTQFVLEGVYRPVSWLAALVPFFLANNLLLLNQFPDIEADTAAGRLHFPIAYGLRRAGLVYGVFAFAVMLVIVAGMVSGLLPVFSLAVLLIMPLAFVALAGAVTHGRLIGGHPGYLAANAAAAVLAPLVLAAAFTVSI